MTIHEAAGHLRGDGKVGAKVGTVTGLDESSENAALVRVSVRVGPKPRKTKDGLAGPYPEHMSVLVPKTLGLAIGDKVKVTTTVAKEA